MLEIENAIATAFEDFDLVVEAFDKAAGLSEDEIVSDLFPPGHQQIEEIIKAVQTTLSHSLDPTQDFGLGLFFGEVHVKDGGELFSEGMGLFGQRRMRKEASENFTFFFVQVFRILAKGAKTAIQLLILYLGHFLFQTMQFLFSNLFGGLAIMLGNMETVDHNPGSGDLLAYGFGVSLPQVTTHCFHPWQEPGGIERKNSTTSAFSCPGKTPKISISPSLARPVTNVT